MSNTKHTQGSWFVNSFQVWAEKNGKRFGTLIATLRVTDTGDTVAEADARLIAAAPELLDALLLLVGWNPTCRAGIDDEAFDADIERARAAIAKATQP